MLYLFYAKLLSQKFGSIGMFSKLWIPTLRNYYALQRGVKFRHDERDTANSYAQDKNFLTMMTFSVNVLLKMFIF